VLGNATSWSRRWSRSLMQPDDLCAMLMLLRGRRRFLLEGRLVVYLRYWLSCPDPRGVDGPCIADRHALAKPAAAHYDGGCAPGLAGTGELQRISVLKYLEPTGMKLYTYLRFS